MVSVLLRYSKMIRNKLGIGYILFIIGLTALGALLPSKVWATVSCIDIFDDTRRAGIIQKELLRSSAETLGLAIDFIPQSLSTNGPTILRESNFKSRQFKSLKILRELPTQISVELEKIITGAVSPIKIADGVIKISVSSNRGNINKNDSIEILFEKKISHRYLDLYAKIANFVYELQGLEPKHPITGVRMSRENLEILKKGSDVEHYLLFDQKVWETHLRFLQKIWNQLVDFNDKSALIELFSADPTVLPFAGVTTVRSKDSYGDFFEIKRYWKNQIEDPYNILELSTKNDFILRHKLIYSVIYDLPAQSRLRIRSHSSVHTKAYRRLGFIKTKAFIDEQYPDVHVDLLESTRELALEKISKVLGDSKEGP